jgi:Family of unknown function (DUF6511)
MTPCAICGRRTKPHRQWIAPDGTRTCSIRCFENLLGGEQRIMIDPLPLEQAAMDHAGKQAGEYVDAIEKTDLAQFTGEEWATLINVVCSAFIEHLHQEIGRSETDLRYLKEKIEPIPLA